MLFVSFVTVFTLDWKSAGIRFQILPEFIFARSSDFSQTPSVDLVGFMRDSISVDVVRNVRPALPEPSARSSWLMPTMRYSSVSPFASVLDAQRNVLEEVSSTPFEATDGRPGDISYIAPAAPTWVRALVDADGTIDAIEASSGGDAYDADDLAKLITPHDEHGSNSFVWRGRARIALWQPDGAQERALVMAADVTWASVVPDGEASDARVYTFLDVSEAVRFACGLELGCLASCIAIFLAALAVAWAATGRAHRPAAEVEARERVFICTASHDLVTPLMAVTANCDVLEAGKSDRSGLASRVANIRAAADELATRIADMLMHVGGD